MAGQVQAQKEELDVFLLHVVAIITRAGALRQFGYLHLALKSFFDDPSVALQRVEQPGEELQRVSLACKALLLHPAIVASEALSRGD